MKIELVKITHCTKCKKPLVMTDGKSFSALVQKNNPIAICPVCFFGPSSIQPHPKCQAH